MAGPGERAATLSRMFRAKGPRSATLVASVLLASACRDPTQVTVELSTDVDCANLQGTTITNGKLGGIEDVPFATETEACTPTTNDEFIGTIVLFPSESKEEKFGVKVVAGVRRPASECLAPRYEGCIVARRGLKFAPHTPLVLPIVLREACLDVFCDPQTTCVKGECVSATIDPGDCLPPKGCGEDELPTMGDGSVESGAGGASGSAGAGGQDAAAPDASVGGAAGAGGTSSGGGGGAGAPDAGVDRTAAGGAFPDSGSDGAPEAAPDATITCVAPSANCNGVATDGCETNTSDDPAHCGACAHDCFGGACVSGVCGAVTVATSIIGNPWDVTTDATHLYWTENMPGAVGRSLPDGSSLEVLGTGLGSLRGLAVDATHVYFAFHDVNGSIQRVPRAGGTIETFAANEPWPLRVLADATHVYWSCYQNAGRIRRAPKTGGPAETIATETLTWGLALDATTAYFGTYRSNGSIFSVPKGGGATATLTTSMRPTSGVALFGGDVLFTRWQGMTGDVLSVPVSGGTATVLAAGEGNPMSVAADASGTYWTNNGADQLRWLPAGGAPTTLASAVAGPKNLALTATSVYFTITGAVLRVAKP